MIKKNAYPKMLDGSKSLSFLYPGSADIVFSDMIEFHLVPDANMHVATVADLNEDGIPNIAAGRSGMI